MSSSFFPSICRTLENRYIKAQCHEMEIEMRPWNIRLAVLKPIKYRINAGAKDPEEFAINRVEFFFI
jgi:hypothetical protein